MLSEHFARKNSLFFLIQWLLLAVVMAVLAEMVVAPAASWTDVDVAMTVVTCPTMFFTLMMPVTVKMAPLAAARL